MLNMPNQTVIFITARNEAGTIAETIAALDLVIPNTKVVVADDYSTDSTGLVARRQHATVVTNLDRLGKGEAASCAVAATRIDDESLVLLCDGDLGRSASELAKLVEAVRQGSCDLAIAQFKVKQGGGFGIAVGFARRLLKKVTGRKFAAPISGQRAMMGKVLKAVTPFASGFGMELAMTAEAVRLGYRVEEVELELKHRATGRNVAGFLHRGRQLVDFFKVYLRLRKRVNSRRG